VIFKFGGLLDEAKGAADEAGAFTNPQGLLELSVYRQCGLGIPGPCLTFGFEKPAKSLGSRLTIVTT
jgi:hypothetical protein